MISRMFIFMLLSFSSPVLLADACNAITRSQSEEVPLVEQHTCYHYKGMPADAISWSCSNENKEMLTTIKNRVLRCANGYVATCQATLTQEALANPHATSLDPDREALLLPEKARIVTFFYAAQDFKQARLDCLKGGGQWNWSP